MKKLGRFSITIISLLYAHISIANPTISLTQQFLLFQNTYHKVYATPEIAAYRRRIFEENIAKIQKHNAENSTWQLGINEYADETWEEFSENHGLIATPPSSLLTKYHPPHPSTPPDSVDWRTVGAVTPVKNQGQCGSSWAFAATGVMESAGFIQLGTLVSLSEQQFLDCNTSNSGCYVGQIDTALFFAKGGIAREASYPYTARVGTCRSRTPIRYVNEYTAVPPNDEVALTEAVAIQPIAVGVEADAAIFQFYQSGVVTSPSCGTTLNQALLIVGYGTENGIPYWLCKNSWGTSWGNAGYIKIGRNLTASAGPGICGIASYPWAVTVTN